MIFLKKKYSFDCFVGKVFFERPQYNLVVDEDVKKPTNQTIL